jgi:hypothetical protein
MAEHCIYSEGLFVGCRGDRQGQYEWRARIRRSGYVQMVLRSSCRAGGDAVAGLSGTGVEVTRKTTSGRSTTT